jgi:hypothetical protein
LLSNPSLFSLSSHEFHVEDGLFLEVTGSDSSHAFELVDFPLDGHVFLICSEHLHANTFADACNLFAAELLPFIKIEHTVEVHISSQEIRVPLLSAFLFVFRFFSHAHEVS